MSKRFLIKHIYRILFVIFIVIGSNFHVKAQQSLLETTIESAKQFRDKGDFGSAARILHDFDEKYPNNVWILRLYGETLYWMKEYEMSDVVYLRAYQLYPEDYDIIYEYALMLFNWGKYQGSINMMKEYVKKYDNVGGAYSIMGISNYYLGNFKESERQLAKARKLNPNDNNTNRIYFEVSRIVRPWINIGADYNTDNQPLSMLSPKLQAGWYFSKFFNLSLSSNFQMFSSDTINTNFTNVQLANDVSFPKSGFSGRLSVGYYNTSTNKDSDFIWSIKAKQRLGKNLFLEASSEKSPYIYTPYSVSSSFSTNKINASLQWTKDGSWNIKSGYINEIFPDTNYIQTAYAWILSPAIKVSVLEFYFGYSFNYSNAKDTRYTYTNSLDDIILNYTDTTTINGTYNPYFTPHNQFSNSILFNTVVRPSQKFNIKLHSAIGVFSKTMNPYLYLDVKNSGMKFLKQDYYQESFTPMDIGMDIESNIGNKLSLRLSYSYIQTFYFHTNNFSINLKINL